MAPLPPPTAAPTTAPMAAPLPLPASAPTPAPTAAPDPAPMRAPLRMLVAQALAAKAAMRMALSFFDISTLSRLAGTSPRRLEHRRAGRRFIGRHAGARWAARSRHRDRAAAQFLDELAGRFEHIHSLRLLAVAAQGLDQLHPRGD